VDIKTLSYPRKRVSIAFDSKWSRRSHDESGITNLVGWQDVLAMRTVAHLQKVQTDANAAQ